MQMAFFEACLHMRLIVEQICFFAQHLLLMYKHANLLLPASLQSVANVLKSVDLKCLLWPANVIKLVVLMNFA